MKMNWQVTKSDIRWQILHDRLSGSDKRPVVLPLHVSWCNMSLTNIKRNFGQSDSFQNGTCADHYHITNNVRSGTRSGISHHYKQDWNVFFHTKLSNSQSVYSNIRDFYDGQLTAVKLEYLDLLAIMIWLYRGLIFLPIEATYFLEVFRWYFIWSQAQFRIFRAGSSHQATHQACLLTRLVCLNDLNKGYIYCHLKRWPRQEYVFFLPDTLFDKEKATKNT